MVWVECGPKSMFKGSKDAFWIQSFSFSLTSCLTKAKEPSLPYYFIHCKGENRWIPTFPKSNRETQTTSSRIWNWNSDFIFYGDNRYTNQTTVRYPLKLSVAQGLKYEAPCENQTRDLVERIYEANSLTVITRQGALSVFQESGSRPKIWGTLWE